MNTNFDRPFRSISSIKFIFPYNNLSLSDAAAAHATNLTCCQTRVAYNRLYLAQYNNKRW